MLHVATVADPRARYYLDDLGDELRRVAPGLLDPDGRWVGASAAALGLSGAVDSASLQAVLGGRHPRTGRALSARRRSVVAYDLTFSAPKSVSVLFGMGTTAAQGAVVVAHREAVRSALDYLERRAVTARRGTGADRVTLATDGLIAASFTHCLSRAGDPHLHTHVVAANLGHGDDARWSALDGRGLFAHARAAGAVYGAHLRAGLGERLGTAWAWHQGRGWELDGADPLLLSAFSGRAAEINQELGGRVGRSARARHVAWAATRPPKDHGTSGAELAADWSRRAGIASAPGLDPARRSSSPGRLDEHRFAATIAEGTGSGVCRRDVVAAWALASAGGADAGDLQRAVDHWVPVPAGAIGVVEPRVAPSACVPAVHLLRALGARPVAAQGQAVWRDAARAVDRYRERWGVTGPGPLGNDGSALGGLPPRRLAEHLEVTRTLQAARLELGGRIGAGLERDAVHRGR